MGIRNKIVRGIDFVVIVGTLITLAFAVRYAQPLVIAPIDEFNTTTGVLFEFGKADLILIDDNANFTSPDEINAEDNVIVNLKPGHYYWKVVGVRESEIREFTVNSEIELKIKKISDDRYEVVNAGNVELNVDIYNKTKYTGSVVLSVDESKEIEGDRVVASAEGGGNGE